MKNTRHMKKIIGISLADIFFRKIIVFKKKLYIIRM